MKAAVSNCFFAVEPRIIFKTKELVPATKNNVLPTHQQSNVIYEYSCHCDSRYVGRTSQRLLDRINQHIPKSIRNANSILKRSLPSRACKSSTPNPTQTCDSAIGLQLLLKTLHVLNIITKTDSAFSPEVALPSISLFWNLFLLKHQTPTFAGKKNLFTVSRSIAD